MNVVFRSFVASAVLASGSFLVGAEKAAKAASIDEIRQRPFDLVVVEATPGGIAMAVRAAGNAARNWQPAANSFVS